MSDEETLSVSFEISLERIRELIIREIKPLLASRRLEYTVASACREAARQQVMDLIKPLVQKWVAQHEGEILKVAESVIGEAVLESIKTYAKSVATPSVKAWRPEIKVKVKQKLEEKRAEAA